MRPVFGVLLGVIFGFGIGWYLRPMVAVSVSEARQRESGSEAPGARRGARPRPIEAKPEDFAKFVHEFSQRTNPIGSLECIEIVARYGVELNRLRDTLRDFKETSGEVTFHGRGPFGVENNYIREWRSAGDSDYVERRGGKWFDRENKNYSDDFVDQYFGIEVVPFLKGMNDLKLDSVILTPDCVNFNWFVFRFRRELYWSERKPPSDSIDLGGGWYCPSGH